MFSIIVDKLSSPLWSNVTEIYFKQKMQKLEKEVIYETLGTNAKMAYI